TDMQSQMMVAMLKAQGTSIITETVFENRFMHVEEFRRMNANAKIEGRSVIIEGPSELQGGQVKADDLRAAASIILAGRITERQRSERQKKETELKHIDRVYVNYTGKLQKLGANIERITEKEEAPNVEEISKK